jgi:hypothetical protein
MKFRPLHDRVVLTRRRRYHHPRRHDGRRMELSPNFNDGGIRHALFNAVIHQVSGGKGRVTPAQFGIDQGCE